MTISRSREPLIGFVLIWIFANTSCLKKNRIDLYHLSCSREYNSVTLFSRKSTQCYTCNIVKITIGFSVAVHHAEVLHVSYYLKHESNNFAVFGSVHTKVNKVIKLKIKIKWTWHNSLWLCISFYTTVVSSCYKISSSSQAYSDPLRNFIY